MSSRMISLRMFEWYFLHWRLQFRVSAAAILSSSHGIWAESSVMMLIAAWRFLLYGESAHRDVVCTREKAMLYGWPMRYSNCIAPLAFPLCLEISIHLYYLSGCITVQLNHMYVFADILGSRLASIKWQVKLALSHKQCAPWMFCRVHKCLF